MFASAGFAYKCRLPLLHVVRLILNLYNKIMTFIKVLEIPSSNSDRPSTSHLIRKDQICVYLHEHFGNCHQSVEAIPKSSAADPATTQSTHSATTAYLLEFAISHEAAR